MTRYFSVGTIGGQLSQWGQSPPAKNKAHADIAHQDHYPYIGQLPIRATPTRVTIASETTHQDQYMYGGELSWWGVVRIRNINHINDLQLE